MEELYFEFILHHKCTNLVERISLIERDMVTVCGDGIGQYLIPLGIYNVCIR